MRWNVFFIIVGSFIIGACVDRRDFAGFLAVIANVISVALNTFNLFAFSAKEYVGQVSHD